MSFKKVLLGLAALLIAYFGIRAIVIALASPQTKIRWVVEDMVEGFNVAHAGPVLDGIDRDFADRTSDISREDLRSTLAYVFLNETDERGACLWSVSCDTDAMEIEVAADERSADVVCKLKLFQRQKDEPELKWDARIVGKLALGEDGWKWTEVTEANHEDRRRR